MSLLDDVLADLEAEGARLESLVADLPEAGWRTATPAPGWDVATVVAHLAWTDEAAHAAATDQAAWDALVLEGVARPERAVASVALAGGAAAPDALLARWRTVGSRLAEALRGYP